MREQIRQLAFFVAFLSTCYSTPEDISSCVGSDVNIPWEYPDSAGMSTVSWEHIDASNVATTILLQAAGSNASIIGGYNIQHNTNGNVTITAATVANTGTYRITVAYSSATPTFTDNVVVNVYDPPTDFNLTESSSGSQTTFTCTASSLGDPTAILYIQVNGVDMTASVSATVSETGTVKCFLSGPSVQCMSGVSGTVTSICAQCPTTGDDSLSAGKIAGIVTGSVGGAGLLVGGAIFAYFKCKGDKEDTSRDVESTRSSPEKAENKLLNKEKQSSATGKADGGNKGKHVSDTQIHLDKSQKVHPENEEKLFRPQPLPPPGAKLNHSLAEDKHGTGAQDFSRTKLPPILQNT